MPTQSLVLLFVVVLALFIILNGAFFVVERGTTAIVQRLGKFLREAKPGLHIKLPLLDKISGRVDLRFQQLNVRIKTKTEDDIFVFIVVAVRYYVLPEKAFDAFYKLNNVTRQITSFAFDFVRTQASKSKLDDLFEKKDEIADSVKSELAFAMEGFGYGILRALIIDVEPDAQARESMSEINSRQQRRVATKKGERILKVVRLPLRSGSSMVDEF